MLTALNSSSYLAEEGKKGKSYSVQYIQYILVITGTYKTDFEKIFDLL